MKTIKPLIFSLFLTISSILLNSCSEDTTLASDPFVVAFESLSKNLIEIEGEETISLVYSDVAYETGTVTIQIDETNGVYGVDYTTIPEASNHILTLPISAGENTNTIIFNKLNPLLDETTTIAFNIISINHGNSNIQGNSTFSLNASASLGGSIEPELGGPNQGYQVFIDLSSEASTAIQRDSWDLGLYSGETFRVIINGSIYMAASPLNFTNIDAVNQNDVKTLMGSTTIGVSGSASYINDPSGNINNSPFSEISDNDNENKVYLVNLGYEIGTSTPPVGDAAIAGKARGWKKIRILKSGDNYILQYANIDATTHQEITISKNSNYSFSFFSFNTNNMVTVEPEKERWDISFTVFTQVLDFGGGELGAYGFSDYVISNRQGGVEAYMVETNASLFNDFTLNQVNNTLFSKDQTTIGSNWRDVFSRSAFSDRFYILKDPNNNIYKIRFLAMTNSDGVRGHPKFEYKLLQ